MLSALREYYDRHGIGAMSFSCPYSSSCSAGAPRFTTAKESFVGPEYERGTLPRLLFLSLDSGSADTEPSRRTLQAVRAHELNEDVDTLHKAQHWYLTHELALVLLRQFMPSLDVGQTSPYFAHVNSAKCCLNKAGNQQADDTLFRNCQQFLPGELAILRPDILVTQGAPAKRAMERLRPVGPYTRRKGETCEVFVVTIEERRAIWLPTYHPSAYGRFWQEKKDCWSVFAEAVGEFVRHGGLDTWSTREATGNAPTPRLVRAPRSAQPSSTATTDKAVLSAQEQTLRAVGDLLLAARAIVSTDAFDAFVSNTRRVMPKPSEKHVGILSGMRVQVFQNWLLDQNHRLQLTDAQLLAVLRLEFPLASSKLFTGDLRDGLQIVAGIRAHYNRDGHHGPSPQSRGMPPSVSYGRFPAPDATTRSSD